jgi:DivIVA domain-containing protein
MALDRQSVMRTDFPMSRRGYDRIAVDRHLDEIARGIEALQRPSVGAAASVQVQSILDAAEASAAAIEQRAWDDAGRVQEAADTALARAREHVGAVGSASRMLRERIEGLMAEVEALEASLEGMTAAPAQLSLDPQDTMAFDPILEEDVAEAALAETSEPTEPQAPQALQVPPAREPRFGRDPDHRTGWLTQSPPTPPPWTGTEQARESARLVALNMADGGQPREAADAYLADLYPPAERAALLDEIYSKR